MGKVKFSELKEGMVLIADGYFDCTQAGERYILHEGDCPYSDYIICSMGKHCVIRCDQEGFILGFTKEEEI